MAALTWMEKIGLSKFTYDVVVFYPKCSCGMNFMKEQTFFSFFNISTHSTESHNINCFFRRAFSRQITDSCMHCTVIET